MAVTIEEHDAVFNPPAWLGSLELFAGAGGLALGLQRAGFSPQAVVELDRRAVETLRVNGSTSGPAGVEWPVLQADVQTLSFEEFRGIDLIAAGPPCQPFSIGGHRRGRHDDRDLLPEALRAIREAKPKAFLIENVRGLTFPAASEYLNYTVAQLRTPSLTVDGLNEPSHIRRLREVPGAEREYRVVWRLINAADYGVPQQRVRLVIIGIRADLREWSWPTVTHGRRALMKALDGEAYWDRHGVTAAIRERNRVVTRATKGALLTGTDNAQVPWVTVRDMTRRLGEPGSEPADPQHQLIPGARLYKKHQGSLLDWPAKTVKAGVHGTPGGEHIVRLDDGSHRYFTVRECAVLQGFPTDYQLPSLRSVALRQLGNAVPVDLAEALGRQLALLIRQPAEEEG